MRLLPVFKSFAHLNLRDFGHPTTTSRKGSDPLILGQKIIGLIKEIGMYLYTIVSKLLAVCQATDHKEGETLTSKHAFLRPTWPLHRVFSFPNQVYLILNEKS